MASILWKSQGSPSTPINSNSCSILSEPSVSQLLSEESDSVVDQVYYTSEKAYLDPNENIQDHEFRIHEINTLEWDELVVPEDPNKLIAPEAGIISGFEQQNQYEGSCYTSSASTFSCLTFAELLVFDQKMGLSNDLTKKTPIFHLPVWALVVIFVVVHMVLLVLPLCISRRKSKKATDKLPISQNQIVSSEFKEIRMDQNSANNFVAYGGNFSTSENKFNGKDSDKLLENLRDDQIKNANINSRSGSFNKLEDNDIGSESGEKGNRNNSYQPSLHLQNACSPLSGLPEFSQLGWGHWFTLRDLEDAQLNIFT